MCGRLIVPASTTGSLTSVEQEPQPQREGCPEINRCNDHRCPCVRLKRREERYRPRKADACGKREAAAYTAEPRRFAARTKGQCRYRTRREPQVIDPPQR